MYVFGGGQLYETKDLHEDGCEESYKFTGRQCMRTYTIDTDIKVCNRDLTYPSCSRCLKCNMSRSRGPRMEIDEQDLGQLYRCQHMKRNYGHSYVTGVVFESFPHHLQAILQPALH